MSFLLLKTATLNLGLLGVSSQVMTLWVLHLVSSPEAVTCDSQLLATFQEEPVPEAGRVEEVSELIKT